MELGDLACQGNRIDLAEVGLVVTLGRYAVATLVTGWRDRGSYVCHD